MGTTQDCNGLTVTCQYHDADVKVAFPGFAPESREGVEVVPPSVLTMNSWDVVIVPWDCDGIVALRMGIEDSPTLTLTMDADKARKLAAALIRQADIEDAKIDDAEFDED